MEVNTAATVQAVAAGVAAGTTIWLAYLTARYVTLTQSMLSAMREVREPAVEIDVEFEDDFLLLVVVNRGGTPAADVRIQIASPLRWLDAEGAHLTRLPAFRDGIDFLAPGRALKFHGGHVNWKLMTAAESHVNAGISYLDSGRKRISRSVSINVRQYEGAHVDSFRTPAESIATSLSEMNRREFHADVERQREATRLKAP